ncbi:hypothetical protein ACFFS4_16270 [Kutzneria kofuensis]|uniref:Uncharacterized protein n=1 Tax=Kutzneria kofuensis TaxID=103725 RepID=A0A7W9KHE5_9PSEU|nr:hypothetical protein [Kutzneria kofuensis]MBB5892616.1 hypothetical protein [Kutzneria kofuensis]
MSTSSDHVYTPEPIDRQQEAAQQLVDLFVNGTDDQRQAIANTHGDRARRRH